MIDHDFDLYEFFKIDGFIKISLPFRANTKDVFDLAQITNAVKDEELRAELLKIIGNKNYNYVVKKCEPFLDDYGIFFSIFIYGDVMEREK